MPFNKRWDPLTDDYIVDRDLTGPPKSSAETGTVRSADGTIVADSSTISITPPTPISVDLPSPNDPIVGPDGRINHRWWRFLNQLYLRTGGVVDNINRVPTTTVGSGTTAALAITGSAPTLAYDWVDKPSVGSMTITGAAPTIV